MTEKQPTPGMHDNLTPILDDSGQGSGMGFCPVASDDEPHLCPICQVPFQPDDLCAEDITEGTCHFDCLDGSPVVDLETGEELPDQDMHSFPYSEVMDPPPAPNVVAPDTATVAAHMRDFEAFVLKTAPKLHWKVWQDLGADPSRSNGSYDGWQHGFVQALFGPLPLAQLMDEMKASVMTKVAAIAATEG